MNALSMYSGGCDGISLSASWLGITTLAYCDSDAACRAVLCARHPDAPIFTNDEDVTPYALLANGIDPDAIDIIFGGPPCQIASVAGQRLGAADPRNRWPQFLRVVRGIRPRWIMAENVPGLLSAKGKNGLKGELFGDILSALGQMGYRVGWCCYGAADVGAPHKRERLFIVGYAEHDGFAATEVGGRPDAGDDRGTTRTLRPGEPARSGRQRASMADTQGAGLSQRLCGPRTAPEHAPRPERLGVAVEHTGSAGCQEHDAASVANGQGYAARRPVESGCARPAQPGLDGGSPGLSPWLDAVAARLASQRWPAGRGDPQFEWEPPRIAEGVPDRAARIRMIGNSCPPQQYAVMLAAITDAHRRIGGDESH